MIKAVILGCGPRSHYHAAAYKGLEGMELVAVCDMNKERLEAYGAKFGVKRLYSSLEEMLKVERPELLHIVTPPAIREEPMELAGRLGVKGIIVEKPLALSPSQERRIEAVARKYKLKVAVNTQRAYFHTTLALKKVLDEKRLGDLVFARCVTKGNILSMGPHLINLLGAFLNGAAPSAAWACARGWNGEDYGHPAPANILARLSYPNNFEVYFEDAEDCVGTPGEADFWQHFEIDFWGTKGRAWWQQNREWGYHCEGMDKPFSAPSIWEHDEEPGQREFTRAMGLWLADDSKKHACSLDSSISQLNQLMGIMLSALEGREVKLPVEVDDNVLKRLGAMLKK